MATLVYDSDHRHSTTLLGTCKGCGGTLWQTWGLPEKCDVCLGGTQGEIDPEGKPESVVYKHDELAGKVKATARKKPSG